ncbi:cupin domain-containing protein [Haloterrigena sp. H1]|uniref:cupin domain-containing protein n=1 Tax=Haloterrigena sp. H1 TaxID=2552943 RepID=UPI00110D2DBA|nr:cupin domain-containing protein [Haloterrigena sp. H1]TMT86793.1 cupin domain-containing protein [Haloterrigena sp. H1]
MPEITSVDSLESTPHAEVFDTDAPRTVRLQLEADERMPKHRHPESNVVLYVLEGTLALTLGDDSYDLEAGDVVRFDGDQDISPHARTECASLLVFAPKTDS